MPKIVKYPLPDMPQAKLKQLNAAAVMTANDLLQHIPRRYIFWIEPVTDMSTLTYEDHKQIVVKLKIIKRREISKGVMFLCKDMKEAFMNVFIFYNKYINFLPGEIIYFYGTAKYSFEYNSWSFSASSHRRPSEITIEPVYPKIKGMSSEYISRLVNIVLENPEYSDYLPDNILAEYGLCDSKTAYAQLHAPTDRETLLKATKRYIFDVLFEYVSALNSQTGTEKDSVPVNVTSLDVWNSIKLKLPFSLTESQNTAVKKIVEKLANDDYVNVLIQGDVGSGKTMLALFAASICIENGYQCAVLAPTEVLAKQHYEEFSSYLGDSVVFLGGSTKAAEKKAINKRLSEKEPLVVVGTHAIIQKSVQYTTLAFAVIDEQHRFGLEQRAALTSMTPVPHTMIMSATPIPRTMAEAAYGDQIDVINIAKPAVRLPVITTSVHKADAGYEKIYNEVLMGHQAYIICPLIEESDSERMSDIQSVRQEEINCANYFTKHCKEKVRVVSINGKMKKEEIENIINAFKNREYDVLISTTIIEVGVNVPNTTVIMIRNSERFGLATLHQLRGRVGRSSLQSYCILQSEQDNERNEIMCSTNDGYEIARKDLELRGPGNFLSTQQSGFSKQMQMMLAYPDIYRLAKDVYYNSGAPES